MYHENPSKDTGDIVETYTLRRTDGLKHHGSMERGVQNIIGSGAYGEGLIDDSTPAPMVFTSCICVYVL